MTKKPLADVLSVKIRIENAVAPGCTRVPSSTGGSGPEATEGRTASWIYCGTIGSQARPCCPLAGETVAPLGGTPPVTRLLSVATTAWCGEPAPITRTVLIRPLSNTTRHPIHFREERGNGWGAVLYYLRAGSIMSAALLAEGWGVGQLATSHSRRFPAQSSMLPAAPRATATNGQQPTIRCLSCTRSLSRSSCSGSSFHCGP